MADKPSFGAPGGGEEIRIRGIVQGVGFRPMVYKVASALGLSGEVCNDGEGVLIRVRAAARAVDAFLDRLRAEAPPLARIDSVRRQPGAMPAVEGFRIVASRPGRARTAVSPDAATCSACRAELDASGDRRYRYPFVNCTHCGPRFSIVSAIPYDRANTSMKDFPMCPDCMREYRDPADRRYHAQPNACADCGPALTLEPAAASFGRDAAEQAAHLLRQGAIVAVKGLGGFHLACDAASERAVSRLRARKRRYEKPFALMARDIGTIRRYCDPGRLECALLASAAAPIVLLPARGPGRLAESVAPGQHCYGFMLPYTPLHHLLLANLPDPIVLTSGNRSQEPQCVGNREARDALGGVADYFLFHDRDIVNRLDDSVARVVGGTPRLLRRARGYAPAPLPLPPGFEKAPPVLAFGGELKSTFCLLRDGHAILSQHLGDLENARAYEAFRKTLALYLQIYDLRPAVLAVDLHPDYLSSKLGRRRAADGGRIIETQHHHAHIAACLAENGVPLDAPPVLGVALDGLGYGEDGSFWGGEFLCADYRGYRRLACFEPVPMPGGAAAIREPWRMACAYLRRYGSRLPWESLPVFRSLHRRRATLERMIAQGINTPSTTSCGRLFDAVAAVIGLRREVTYEGQAAIELEAVARGATRQGDLCYSFDIMAGHETGCASLSTQPLWPALLADLAAGVSPGRISRRFHQGLAQAVAGMIAHLSKRHGDPWQGRVALSGGVFQNALLTGELLGLLQKSGFQVLSHSRVPANDGGLSLGQAAIAAARTLAD